MAEPTTEALLAEAEARRLELRGQEEMTEHWRKEAGRLSILLKHAERDHNRLTSELEEAQRSMSAQHALLTEHRTQLKDAKAEAEETDQLNTRLRNLLVGVANALKGPPPPLVWHDWSDLPDVAAKLKAEVDNLRARLSATETHG